VSPPGKGGRVGSIGNAVTDSEAATGTVCGPACFDVLSPDLSPSIAMSPSVFSIQFLSTLVCDAESQLVVDVLLPTLFFLACLVLIDTGACVTCMSSSFAASHGFSVGPGEARGIFSACGRRLNVVGVCSLVFSFGPMFTVRWPVVVIDGLQHPFLIGRDVLRYLRLAVFVNGKSVSVCDGEGVGACSVCGVCESCCVMPTDSPTWRKRLSSPLLYAPPVFPPPQLPRGVCEAPVTGPYPVGWVPPPAQ